MDFLHYLYSHNFHSDDVDSTEIFADTKITLCALQQSEVFSVLFFSTGLIVSFDALGRFLGKRKSV